MSKNEIANKVRALKELQALIDEAEQEAEAIKDELKAYMSEQDTDEIVVDIFKVRYAKVKSTRFDSNAFKKTHGELYAQYSKVSEYNRLTIA